MMPTTGDRERLGEGARDLSEGRLSVVRRSRVFVAGEQQAVPDAES